MPKRLTTQDFINKALTAHGETYNYSLSQYLNAKTKINIICSEHGVFKQLPNDHFKGKGCKKCGNINTGLSKLSNKETFLYKAKLIHGDKYKYNLTNYTKCDIKVIITCPKHGNFLQIPESHLQGRGCNKCGEKRTANSHKLTTKSFINKAIKIHNNRYTYSKTRYTNSTTKTIITCKEHGDFEQVADKHLQGKGCRKCGNTKTSERMQLNNPGWTYSNWKKAGEKSKNFDSFKVYIIRCWSDDEEFYKIGKTYLKVKKRFDYIKTMPYQYESVKIIKGEAEEISILERKLQKTHKEFKYRPKISFEGVTECFSKIIENV